MNTLNDNYDKTNSVKMVNGDDFTVTIFTDLHHSVKDVNGFFCTKALEKLDKIVKNSQDSEIFISLGDFVNDLDKTTAYYDTAISHAEKLGLSYYSPTKEQKGKVLFNVIGNHETAFLPKSEFSKYVPYQHGIGSVYSFAKNGVLFVVVDANFNRELVVDTPQIMQTTTQFTIPDNQIEYINNLVKNQITKEIKSIVWLSHVAFKDIDDKKWELAKVLSSFNRPIAIFEGHTHIGAKYSAESENLKLDVYTLPPVTNDFTLALDKSEKTFSYCKVKFSNGQIASVDYITNEI